MNAAILFFLVTFSTSGSGNMQVIAKFKDDTQCLLAKRAFEVAGQGDRPYSNLSMQCVPIKGAI